MLRPASDDPNREAEIKRLAKEPQTAGGGQTIPHDWTPTPLKRGMTVAEVEEVKAKRSNKK